MSLSPIIPMLALFLLICLTSGCAPRSVYVVPVSRSVFAARFPDAPHLMERQVGCLRYEVQAFTGDRSMFDFPPIVCYVRAHP